MNTRIKICGLMRKEDVEAVNDFLPDYIGFVFAGKSRRYVTPRQAKALAAELSPGIRKTGVFVNEEIPVILELLEQGVIDVVQLHGQEDRKYVTELLQKIGRLTAGRPDRYHPDQRGKTGNIRLIQAFPVRTKEDIQRAEESQADLVLFDQGAGGTGKCFDWELAKGLKRPFFLAGGLNESNVEEAVRRLSPYGVDISSGVETEGKKDREKIKRIIGRIRYGKGQIRHPRGTIYTGDIDE